MAYHDQMFSVAKIFEERSKEIDAEKRSINDPPPSEPDRENQPISHHVIEAEGRAAYIIEMQGNKSLRTVAADSAEGMLILQQAQPNVLNPVVTPPSTPVEFERELQLAQELAAVSGRVDPDDLVAKELPAEIRQAVLSNLSAQCTIETHQGRVQWLLSKTVRNTALHQLSETDRLSDLLAGPLPPTDHFGQVLRSLLRKGAGIELENLEREQLLNLTAAMEATADSELPQPDVIDVRRSLGQKEFLSEYDVLFARGFVGRSKELEELHKFLSNSNDQRLGSWTSLVLTGIGGSGKSTLLAKFARDVAKEKLATVVILDFDRPGIDARDFYWMEQEISRQVGHQYLEVSEFLRSRRFEERQYRNQYIDLVDVLEMTEHQRSSRSIISNVADALTSAGADNRPFLLVLDTYEQIEEQELSAKVFDWLYELAPYLHSTPLKVIFSGRLYDENLELLKQQSRATVLNIGELEPADAEELLLKNGIPAPTAKRLVRSEVLPRRPLELTLLAKITTDLDKTIDELEDELREGGESAKNLFAGLVYRRVLSRLQNPAAQRLAYPGLVLRYVTVDLIRSVLGPALNLPAFDEATAFEALASCTWLVHRQQDEVWHRSDLRRSTLKAMIAAERKNARRISEYAIKYFQERSDPRSRAEAVYHRLLWMDDPEQGDRFQLAELKRANDHIKASVGDLPPVAATLLKFAVEGKVPSIELESLPQRYIDSGYSAAGEELVEHRLFGKALKLLDRRHHGAPGQPVSLFEDSEVALFEDWEVDTLFSTAAWDQLVFSEPKIKKPPREAALYVLGRALYPLQLVSPELLLNFPLGELLEAATDDPKFLKVTLRDVDGQESLRRLVISMIYAVAREEKDHGLSKVIDRTTRTRSESEPQLFAPVTERRLSLLELAMSGESLATFSINTVRLTLDWLRDFQTYVDRNRQEISDPPKLKELVADVGQVLAGPTPTLRTRLGAIDALAKEEGIKRVTTLKVTANNTNADEAWKYLRGPSPEFRDPCRFALLEAFPNRAALRKLGEIIASITKLDTPDLQPDAFAEIIIANPEHAIAPYVEFVDRVWALGDLLKQANLEVSSRKLEIVSSAFARWEEALAATINRGLTPSFKQISHP